MKTYQLAQEADLDFLDAYDYLDAHSQSAAARWEKTMLHAFDHLASWPRSGHVREDLAPSPLRLWPVGQYVVVYNPESEILTIIAVLHGARDIASLLKDRI